MAPKAPSAPDWVVNTAWTVLVLCGTTYCILDSMIARRKAEAAKAARARAKAEAKLLSFLRARKDDAAKEVPIEDLVDLETMEFKDFDGHWR